MTRITLYRHDGAYNGLKVIGHSGYAEEGSDIVCAAVSALVINCLNSIEEFTDDDIVGEYEEAAACIEFHLNEEISEAAKLLIASTVLGLENVAADYEECILIEVQEV